MSDFQYLRVLQAVTATPWAILPAKLAIIRDLLAFRATGGVLSADEVKDRLTSTSSATEAASARPETRSQATSVAVLPIIGTIIPRADLITESSGAFSIQRFKKAFRAALADPEIGSIVLDVDSPGGQVGGVMEMAAEIFEARASTSSATGSANGKRIVAVANGLAASAAYWLASAADELVVTPSGEVGSIGVFAMHQDISAYLEKEGVKVDLIHAGKYKTEGNPYEALGEEARGAIQARVDEYYEMFVGDVARNRGTTPTAVMGGFGEGRVVGAETAVRLGMADRVATFDDVINDLLASQATGAGWSADSDMRERRLRAISR